MFKGEYNHTVDEKGRLIIPNKLREELGNSFVVTKGLDGCLSAYAAKDWNEMTEKIKTLHYTNPKARKLTAFMVGGACDAELDKQGRILLPQNLRTFAGLDKDVVLVGMVNRVDIWSKEKWDASCESLDLDDLAEGMEDLGI